jgi:hypothetical protein
MDLLNHAYALCILSGSALTVFRAAERKYRRYPNTLNRLVRNDSWHDFVALDDAFHLALQRCNDAGMLNRVQRVSTSAASQSGLVANSPWAVDPLEPVEARQRSFTLPWPQS